jgi:hypothetical protein
MEVKGLFVTKDCRMEDLSGAPLFLAIFGEQRF